MKIVFVWTTVIADLVTENDYSFSVYRQD